MERYAKQTHVPVYRTVTEIETLLERAGATGFQYGWADEGDCRLMVVRFRLRSLRIKYLFPVPDKASEEFHYTPAGIKRAKGAAQNAWETAVKAQWRTVKELLKLQLHAVEQGIMRFEEVFLPFVENGEGMTIADVVIPQLEQFTGGLGLRALGAGNAAQT